MELLRNYIFYKEYRFYDTCIDGSNDTQYCKSNKIKIVTESTALYNKILARRRTGVPEQRHQSINHDNIVSTQ